MTAAVQGRGRPLRFLALVAVGWVGLRIVLLWPQTGSLPAAVKAVLAPEAKTVEPAPPASPAIPDVARPRPSRMTAASPIRPVITAQLQPAAMPATATGAIQLGPAEAVGPVTPPVLPPPAQTRFAPAPSRWHGSFWLMARPGSGISAAPGGQIGGSQGGFRVGYTLSRRHRVAAFGRFVTPLSRDGREAAIGVEWQPSRAPIRIVAEHRFAINGGRSGPGLGLVAGGELAIPGGFRLETYGQAGAIRRDRVEPYADGAARATRRIAGTPIALGGGAWGAAQRGATRLDIGPSATLTVPVRGQQLRFAVDWRQRVAGDARSGSGVALTLGSDF